MCVCVSVCGGYVCVHVCVVCKCECECVCVCVCVCVGCAQSILWFYSPSVSTQLWPALCSADLMWFSSWLMHIMRRGIGGCGSSRDHVTSGSVLHTE